MKQSSNILILGALALGFSSSGCGTREYASQDENSEKSAVEERETKNDDRGIETPTPIKGAPDRFGLEPLPKEEARNSTLRTDELEAGLLMNKVVDPVGDVFNQSWKEDWQDSESLPLFMPLGVSVVSGGLGLLVFRWAWSLPVTNLKMRKRASGSSQRMPSEHSSRHPHPEPTEPMRGSGGGHRPGDLYPDRMKEGQIRVQGLIASSLGSVAKGSLGACALYLGLVSGAGLGGDYQAAAAATVVGASTGVASYGVLWRPLATDWSRTRLGRFVQSRSKRLSKIHDLTESNRVAYFIRRRALPVGGAGVVTLLTVPYIYEELQESSLPAEENRDPEDSDWE